MENIYGQRSGNSAKVGQKKKQRTIIVGEKFLFNPNYNMTEKFVYQALDMYHNNAVGGSFPSQEALAEQLGISKRTLINTLKSMEEKGMVYIISCRWQNTKIPANNFYVINTPEDDTGLFNKENFKGWKLICPNKKALVSIDEHKNLNHEWL